MDTCFSILIRMEFARPNDQILGRNHQLYNVLITAHAFLMIFFCGYDDDDDNLSSNSTEERGL